MPTNHYAVAAVPATGATDLLRSGLVGRYAYCLAAGESAADFVAIDPSTGAVCPALIQNGALYGLDNLDTTTAAGPTCLVSYDGKRYKLNSLTTPFSVKSKASTSPPGSPVIGDAYLLYSTPSGAWAGKIGYIAIYTSRGWEFMLPPVGFRILVEDEGSFYFRDPSGNWLSGLGSVLVSDSSIALSKLIWDGRVQNQTTNAPPSAAQGVAYIIGSSPTGAWAGNAGKIAIRESAGTNSTYVIYTPKVGQAVFDISLNTTYVWTGLIWKAQFSGYSEVISAVLASNDTLNSAGIADNGTAYSPTVPPSTTGSGRSVITEALTANVTADVAGQTVEVEYLATMYGGSPSVQTIRTAGGSGAYTHQQIIMAIYVDNETSAREWLLLYNSSVGGSSDNDWADAAAKLRQLAGKFAITLGDTAQHTIKIRFHCRINFASVANGAFSMDVARRSLTIRKRR